MDLSAGANFGPYEAGGDSRALARFESEAKAVAAVSRRHILEARKSKAEVSFARAT